MTWSPNPPPPPARPPVRGWFVTPPTVARAGRCGWWSKPVGFADANAEVGIDASAPVVVTMDGFMTVSPAASGSAAVYQLADGPLLGEGTVTAVVASLAADADVSIDGTGIADIRFDPGFPYTFPFTFGGTIPVRQYPLADAVVDVEATAEPGVGVYAGADVSIDGTPVPPGFPYAFPVTLG